MPLSSTLKADEYAEPRSELWNSTINDSGNLGDPETVEIPDWDYSRQYYYGSFKSRIIEDDEGYTYQHKPVERKPAHEYSSYVDPNEVRESSVFVYKQYVDTDENGNSVLKSHPTWRVGPDMKDPRCWLYAPNGQGKLNPALEGEPFKQFEENQNKSVTDYLQWHEYTDEKWQPISKRNNYTNYTRIKQRVVSPKTAMMTCNTKSEWKQKLDGVYERHEYELNGQTWGCYSRMIYYRCAPDTPYWPPNERPMTPQPTPEPTPEPPKEPTPIPPTPTPTPPPKEPTPVPPTPTPPPKDPTPVPTPTPTPPPKIKLKGAYLYQHKEDGRWRIGPNYEKESAWFFTKGTEVDNAQWYTVDQDKKLISRCNLALTTLPGNENVYTSREREDEKTVESGALSEDMRGNFIGSWIKIEDNVWVHGPINTKEETIEMTLEQAETIAPIYVNGDSFEDIFKRQSCVGFYDKVGDDLYRRREPTMHENRAVWAYKVKGRWAIGPDLGSDKCWGYSQKTSRPMPEVKYWYEARIGEASGTATRKNMSELKQENEFERSTSFTSRG